MAKIPFLIRYWDVEMIGNLLKQLLRALAQFAGYHSRRILRLPEKPTAASPPQASQEFTMHGIATEASIATFSDSVGLDPEYKRQVRWPCYLTDVPPPEVTSNALYKMWTTIPGGHKWSQYFQIYESVFGPIRTEPLRILEIGIWHGASLKLWRKYFEHPKTIIVGVDVLPQCLEFDAPADGVHIRIGSQADPAF